LGWARIRSFFGQRRIRKISRQSTLKQHSQDAYHGTFLLICATVLPLLLLAAWSSFAPLILTNLLQAQLTRLSGAIVDR
jgi:hypothetical protein